MDNLIEISLISETSTTDSIGQQHYEETERVVFGHFRSVSRREWFDAGANDINAEIVVTIYDFEYQDETIAEIGDIRYGVYRTYRLPNSDMIELYLEKKGGVTYE